MTTRQPAPRQPAIDRPLPVSFTDLNGDPRDNKLFQLLERHFPLELDAEAPQYSIYSVFGHEYLQHKDAVRIFYTPENVRPDFNLCDYAFSFDWLEFGDRHVRCPNFVLFEQWNDLCARGSAGLDRDGLARKAQFCNFIYSHGRGHPLRDAFFHALHAVRPVDSLGRHLQNVFDDNEVGPAYQGDWAGQKVAMQRRYRFSIAFENSSTPGYTTEKLVHALAADTIPIYWGDPWVGRVFNPERMINLNELSVEEAVRRVLEIDDDPELFLDIVNKPYFTAGRPPKELLQDTIVAHFAAIFAQPHPTAFRRDFHYWGKKYEADRQLEIETARLVTAELWPSIMPAALRDIEAFVPAETTFILVDNGELGLGDTVADRPCLPFAERDGAFWGLPPDDRAAIDELERQQARGVRYVVVAWPAFWVLHYYSELHRYLRRSGRCVGRTDRVVVFRL